PTTAACPAFGYRPERDATAVSRLIDAGAIVVGKTNLDQFATGLVGTRSPYGVCRSHVNPRYVSGGSSSGSALAVAAGIVPFALGTDTAGSGRVPAAFNGIVGLKPTRGLISLQGVVPACRSLDCVSIFANDLGDAWLLLDRLSAFDPSDPFSRQRGDDVATQSGTRLRLGIPRELESFGNTDYQRLYDEAVTRFSDAGCSLVQFDLQPFTEAGNLLYGGPWVAERYASVGEFIEQHQNAVHPVVRDIILSGKHYSAHDVFRAQYRLQELKQRVDGLWERVDAILLPTTGTIFTVEEVLSDPVATNSKLGRYTNFVNLLDLAGLALPWGQSEERTLPSGQRPEPLPFGVTLIGPAFSEPKLLQIGKRLHR
ncbi:MAG TPA: allophanate hydrolase, partial [Polyangiaceae bacterium]